MDNKLSELSKPYGYEYVTAGRGHVVMSRTLPPVDMREVKPLYSQEYVSALLADNEKKEILLISNAVEYELSATDLLAELEAKDKRIANLERANQSQDDHINQQQDRIDSLEKTNAGLGRRLAAAETRLATPVRLPDGTGWASDPYNQGRNKGIHQCADAIRSAGFTVEGDEH